MDINFLRSVITLVTFALFVGIMVWTWQRSRKAAFDAAAVLPFEGENIEERATGAHP